MGSGKTTVANLLSAKLNDFNLVDLDFEIEKTYGKSIGQIFEDVGESGFRNFEQKIVEKYSMQNNLIISTGGGVVQKIENLNNLKKGGIVFYLYAEVETLFERTKTSTIRPLLQTEQPKEKLKEIYNMRKSFYKMAHYEIQTENKELLEIVEEIIKKYEQN